jgi:CheY-like chemotaxis protein
MAKKTVLTVGHCMADHHGLSLTLQQHFNVHITSADSQAEATAQLEKAPVDLVLVNRLFDRDGASGIDFIRKLKADERFKNLPVMLVSNFEHAHRDALKAGAHPGFGKAALGEPEMLECVRPFLEP